MYSYHDIEKSTYDAFTSGRHEANFLHAWQWGVVHELLGQKVRRVGLYKEDKLVGVLQGVVEDARRGRYLEIAGGPLLDWQDNGLVGTAIGAMSELGKEEKCVFVRFRPQLIYSDEYGKQFRKWGLKKSPMHLHAEHTNVINLLQSEDGLLAAMRKQTRYEIKQSKKRDIAISKFHLPKDIHEFFTLQQETARRQKFYAPHEAFYEALATAFEGSFEIYKATLGGSTLATALVIFKGHEVDYFQGSSTTLGRDVPGAYALQWRIIKDAKKAGYSRYNLFGTSPDGAKNHRYSNVTTFKRGFGGESVQYMPAHDIVLNKVAYIKNWTIETMRKRARKL